MNEKEGGHVMIGQVGFWDKMNTMQELHTLSCDSIGCICFHQNESEVNLTMDLLKTTSMKAMSLGLIRGTIDEVEQLVHVDWSLPRYLSKNHL